MSPRSLESRKSGINSAFSLCLFLALSIATDPLRASNTDVIGLFE